MFPFGVRLTLLGAYWSWRFSFGILPLYNPVSPDTCRKVVKNIQLSMICT
jgi:hypothetical protein